MTRPVLAHLFVTYYTGKPDLVPHEPRECWVASGQTLVGERTMDVKVDRPDPGAPGADINVAVLDFESAALGRVRGDPRRTTVLFFFWGQRPVCNHPQRGAAVGGEPSTPLCVLHKLEISFSD